MSLPLEYFNPDAGGWVLVGEMRRGDGTDEQHLVINTNITWPGYVEYPKIPLDGSTCEAGWYAAAPPCGQPGIRPLRAQSPVMMAAPR